MKLKPCLLLLPPAILAACVGGSGGNDDSSRLNGPVVGTRAHDYSSGAVSLVDTTPPFAASNNENPNRDTSDLAVRADGDHYFLLAKFGVNKISRYDAATPYTATYSYSTNDPGEENSNPYDLIVASPSKGYLLRYGSATNWIDNTIGSTSGRERECQSV